MSPPKEALDSLAAHHLARFGPAQQVKQEALVETLMVEWLKHHVAELAAPERYAYSIDQWIIFLIKRGELTKYLGRP